MPEAFSASLEPFVALANNNANDPMNIVKQAIEAPGTYVFGELLDHPNIAALEKCPAQEGRAHLRLLQIFAYGTYSDYAAESSQMPPLSDQARKKLKLLTVVSLASRAKLIKYEDLQRHLMVSSVRELEDLIIEGSNVNVLRGKLDQKSSHFEVDYVMGRDIKKEDIKKLSETLKLWCQSCEATLVCLEDQVTRANSLKQEDAAHKKTVENKVREIRGQLKAMQYVSEGPDDPDSRMETDRERRDKKGSTKSKPQATRGSSVKASFWPK